MNDARQAEAACENERLDAVRSLIPAGIEATPEMESLTTLASSVFGVAVAAITILNEDWQYVAASTGLDGDGEGCARDESICKNVVARRSSFTVEDLARDARFADLPYVAGGQQFRFYAGAPIELTEGLPVGSFCILDSESRSITPGELATLRHFATVAAGLLKLRRANNMLQLDSDVLKRASLADPMTGFYNRAALSELVDGVIDDAMRKSQEVGVISMDLDRFKAINDRYGHPVGDAVIIEAANRIRAVIRATDMPIRLGGDEFAIFFAAPSGRAVLTSVAERLVDAFRIPFEIDGHAIEARASLGVAVAPQDGEGRDTLARRVDLALYAAKERGRDQYAFFESRMTSNRGRNPDPENEPEK